MESRAIIIHDLLAANIYPQLSYLINSSKAKSIIMFFLESKTTPDSLSFCCVIALECNLSFSNLSGEPSLHPVSKQRKETKFPLMMFEWEVMSVVCL